MNITIPIVISPYDQSSALRAPVASRTYYAEEINREYLLEAIYIAAHKGATSDPVSFLDSTYTIALDDVNKVILDDPSKEAYMRIHRTIRMKHGHN